MNLYLISNNLVVDNIVYETDVSLEAKRLNRPLSIAGENLALALSKTITGQAIYTSDYASAIDSAKYFASALNLPIYIDANLRDSVIGDMGRHNIKMLRFMQERDFNYKYSGGESLNETKLRMKKIIRKIRNENTGDVIIFSHKRAILSYLLDYTEHGYNLDDRLILSFHDQVILDDSEKDMEVIRIELEDDKIIAMENMEMERGKK